MRLLRRKGARGRRRSKKAAWRWREGHDCMMRLSKRIGVRGGFVAVWIGMMHRMDMFYHTPFPCHSVQ